MKTGKTWFFSRFGGIGDAMVLTVVAKAIKDRNPNDMVDFYVRGKEQVSLFENLPIFRHVREIRRFPDPWKGNDCTRTRDGWEFVGRTKEKYDMVIDYVNSIENNSMHPYLAPKFGEWMASQNSNFVNFTDISLAWAKIDPETVADKTPVYRVEAKERKWANERTRNFPSPHIGFNLFASSRARTFFNPEPMVAAIGDAFPDGTLFVWDQERWFAYRKGQIVPITTTTTTRESAALVASFDCAVLADSGFSHIAEAVGTESVTIYTTVPSWTRNKYYKHSHDIDIHLDCKPCFTLHYQCPINRQRAMESLNERERAILDASNQNMPIKEACLKFETTPDKLVQELNSIKAKLDANASVAPDCIKAITPEIVIEKIREALGVRKDEKRTE